MQKNKIKVTQLHVGRNAASAANWSGTGGQTAQTRGIFIGQNGAFNMGSSTVPTIVASGDLPVISVHTTNASTTGNIQMITYNMTKSGTSTSGHYEGFNIYNTVSGKTKGWGNALFVRNNYAANSLAQGQATTISAEMSTPTGTAVSGGTWSCIACELDCAGTGIPSNKTAIIEMNAWGTYVGEFRTNGYIFNISGLGSATSGGIFHASNDTASHGLKINIDNVTYVILLSNNVD